MAFVTPRLSLKVWNSSSDPYDSQQLADNWIKVDLHDHTPGRGTQIPTEGLADLSVTGIKILDATLTNAKFVDGTLTGAKIAPDTVANSNLAPDAKVDPLFNARRTLFERVQFIDNSNSAGQFVMQFTTTRSWADSFYLDPADWPSGTRTARIRVLGGVAANSTASGVFYTLGLAPITSSTGTTPPLPIAGANVVSTTAIGVPTSTNASFIPSPWINFPTAGYYGLTVTTNNILNVGSSVAVRGQVQVQII